VEWPASYDTIIPRIRIVVKVIAPSHVSIVRKRMNTPKGDNGSDGSMMKPRYIDVIHSRIVAAIRAAGEMYTLIFGIV
jgi:hypothetical protein